VNGETSRPAGGIFVGLRHDLFSRLERPAVAVEQVCRWLCHTAVTPIHAVRTRSYLLAHILRPVTIRVGYQLTRRTNVQTTFNTVQCRVVTTPRAGLRGIPPVLFQHLNTAQLTFVFKVLVDAVERPGVEFLIAGFAPV
jgi:hypothetical protein